LNSNYRKQDQLKESKPILILSSKKEKKRKDNRSNSWWVILIMVIFPKMIFPFHSNPRDPINVEMRRVSKRVEALVHPNLVNAEVARAYDIN
jgi:hypothetical protein